MARWITVIFLFLALSQTAVSQHGNHNEGVQSASPQQLGQTGLLGGRFLDVDGRVRTLGDEGGTRGFGLVFISDGCQNSLVYAAELNDFATQARAQNIELYAVINSPRLSWAQARALRDTLGLSLPTLFDPSGELSHRLQVGVTPQAVLMSPQDQVVYTGRLDDRFAGLGQRRKVIRNHDLLDAMQRMGRGDFRFASAETIGCFIEDRSPPSSRQVTYHRDVAPLLAANCTSCHRPQGSAPFRLDTAEQATTRARMIADVAVEGYMPPWKALPHLGRFRDERVLSAEQIGVLEQWLRLNQPLGNPQDAAPKTPLSASRWPLGQPDAVVAMAQPYDVPAKGEDVYRYFVLPGKLVQDLTVTAIDFLPGDPSVVHHANFFIDFSGKARREDAKDNEPGFSVFGTGSFMDYTSKDSNTFGIGGWAPGAEPYQLPKDAGIWLAKGGELVIEIHYKLNGKATRDQSKLGLYFAKEPVKHYLDGLLVGTQDIDIAPQDKAYVRQVSMKVPEDFHLVDLMPHMHYIGSRVRVQLTHPNGHVENIIGIDDWDLRWQNIYSLRQPKLIKKGSRLDFWFEWDNSDDNFDNPNYPAQRIQWGWNSEDEMAEVWMGIIPKNWRNTRTLHRAADQSWINGRASRLPN